MQEIKPAKEDLMQELDEKQDELQDLEQERDNFKIDESDKENEYDEILDMGGAVDIGDVSLYPSDILKECDYTAYRCGLLDYVDTLDVEEEKEYQNIEEQIDDLQYEIEILEEQIGELED